MMSGDSFTQNDHNVEFDDEFITSELGEFLRHVTVDGEHHFQAPHQLPPQNSGVGGTFHTLLTQGSGAGNQQPSTLSFAHPTNHSDPRQMAGDQPVYPQASNGVHHVFKQDDTGDGSPIVPSKIQFTMLPNTSNNLHFTLTNEQLYALLQMQGADSVSQGAISMPNGILNFGIDRNNFASASNSMPAAFDANAIFGMVNQMINLSEHKAGTNGVLPVTVPSPVGKIQSPLHSSMPSSPGSGYSSQGGMDSINTTKEIPHRQRKKRRRANSPPISPARTPTENSPTHTPPNSPLSHSPIRYSQHTPGHSDNVSPLGSYADESSFNKYLAMKHESNPEKLPRHKRASHVRAEVKRRDKIQTAMQQLQEIVPSLRNSLDQGNRDSKAAILQKTVEHCRQLKIDSKNVSHELKKVNEEIDRLSNSINDFQETLPLRGFGETPASNPPSLEKLMQDHRTMWLQRRWTYGIFLMLTHAMKDNYPVRMSTVKTLAEFQHQLVRWLEEEGALPAIRTSAIKTLRSLSTETSVMTTPECLPKEIVELIRRKRAEATGGGSSSKSSKS